MIAFIASFLFVLLAEMGDKTQLLAMAFAAKYRAGKVLFAVFIATLLNHTLAVAAGHLLSAVLPISIISVVASLSFIGYGLWTIRGDQLEGEDKKGSKYGPIITVGIAFFLAEMGDKTQLATISLAVEYNNAFAVLMGTTAGMVVADTFGIIIGIVLGKHLPKESIKWFSAIIFILFGLSGLYKSLIGILGSSYLLLVLGLIVAFTSGSIYWMIKKDTGRKSASDNLSLNKLKDS